MRLRFICILLCFMLLLPSCSLDPAYSGRKLLEFSLRAYTVGDEVMEMHSIYRLDFLKIDQMLRTKEAFFFEHDNRLFPGAWHDCSDHFTQEEWQDVQRFVNLTGLYGISFGREWVHSGEQEERSGVRMEYVFSGNDKETMFSIVSIAPADDREMEKKLIDDWFAIREISGTVELESLGDGWYFVVSK